MDRSGRFVITWQDFRNGNYDIYAQRYSSLGVTLGSNFKVNGDAGTARQRYPSVAVNGSGSTVITWQDLRNGNYDIYAQRYDTSGGVNDSNFKVNDDPGSAAAFFPAVAKGSTG